MWTMIVEIVKKNNPAFLQWSCTHARRNHEKKIFDCYKDKMIQLWPYFFFQNLVFYDQNEYWRNSSSYKVCMVFNVADFTLSLNTEITYSVLDAYYPNTAIDAIFLFCSKGLIKGPSCHSYPTKPFDRVISH